MGKSSASLRKRFRYTHDAMTLYFDHASTSPLCEAAREAMRPWLEGRFGNPSGVHQVSREAKKTVEEAREIVAEALHAHVDEVYFTSGGTEANNLALRGQSAETTIIATAIEHPAVLAPASERGAHVLSVTEDGIVDLDHLEALLGSQHGPVVVTVMGANNETGVVQPLHKVSRLLEKRGNAALHTDAAQAAGWKNLCKNTRFADLVSITAHKFGGPQGVGALIIRKNARAGMRPFVRGGSQEREMRPGTHNVMGIVGMAAALRASHQIDVAQVEAKRERLEAGLQRLGLQVTGKSVLRAPHVTHLIIPDVESEILLAMLDQRGLCASGGSACSSGAFEPSHVLLAMGHQAEEVRGALRLSIGSETTDAEVDEAVAMVGDVVEALRT